MTYQKGELRLQEAMTFIIEHYQENGYAPSMRELCKGIGVKSPSHAKKILDQLEERFLISRDGSKYRTIKVLEEAYDFVSQPWRRMEEAFLIPIAGRIVASEPLPVPDTSLNYYDEESSVRVLSSSLPKNEKIHNLFALEVDGDSMIDSMVNDGDIVILRRANEVNNGEMAAVRLKERNETTLKHFYKREGKVILHPANPTMQDIVIENPAQVEVQGKVVLVIRQP